MTSLSSLHWSVSPARKDDGHADDVQIGGYGNGIAEIVGKSSNNKSAWYFC